MQHGTDLPAFDIPAELHKAKAQVYTNSRFRVKPSASSTTTPGTAAVPSLTKVSPGGAATPDAPGFQTIPAGGEPLASEDVEAELGQLEQLLRQAWGQKQLQMEAFIRLLGLQHCRGTAVGGPMLRGLSGGEHQGCAATHAAARAQSGT